MRTSEILRRAKSLIDSPDKWTQGIMARSKDGIPVIYNNPEACRFCALGAIWRCDIETSGAEKTLRSVLPCYSITEFNDDSTHDQVMAAFDLAIKVATEQEKTQQQ